MRDHALEGICLGDTVYSSHEISRQDEDDLIRLSGDANPLHSDDAFARQHSFRERLAHGLLVSSCLLPAFAKLSAAPGFLCLSQTLQYRKPVYVGDRLEAVVRVVHKSEATRVLVVATTVLNQEGEPVLTGEAKIQLLG